eukprot:g1661.t1
MQAFMPSQHSEQLEQRTLVQEQIQHLETINQGKIAGDLQQARINDDQQSQQRMQVVQSYGIATGLSMPQHTEGGMQPVGMNPPHQIQMGADQEQLLYLRQQHEAQQRQIAELQQQLMQQQQLNKLQDQGVGGVALHRPINDMQHMQAQGFRQSFGQFDNMANAGGGRGGRGSSSTSRGRGRSFGFGRGARSNSNNFFGGGMTVREMLLGAAAAEASQSAEDDEDAYCYGQRYKRYNSIRDHALAKVRAFSRDALRRDPKWPPPSCLGRGARRDRQQPWRTGSSDMVDLSTGQGQLALQRALGGAGPGVATATADAIGEQLWLDSMLVSNESQQQNRGSYMYGDGNGAGFDGFDDDWPPKSRRSRAPRRRRDTLPPPPPNANGKYECDACGKEFDKPAGLSGHRRFCTGGSWSCQWCGAKENEVSGKSPGPEGPKTLCSACGARFRAGHTKYASRNEEGKFVCDACGQTFETMRGLGSHRRGCTGGTWRCKWCDCSEKETSGKTPGPDGPKTLCGPCGARWRAGHSGPPQQNADGKYVCPACEKTFDSIPGLGGHMRFCSGGNWTCEWCGIPELETHGKSPGPNGPKTLCTACGSRFRAGHTRMVSKTEDGKFICDDCSKTFDTIGALGGHRRFCTGGKWQCEWCEAKEQDTSGKSPGPNGPKTLCAVCGSRFRAGHTGPPKRDSDGKYVCDDCGKTFDSMTGLGGHRRFCMSLGRGTNALLMIDENGASPDDGVVKRKQGADKVKLPDEDVGLSTEACVDGMVSGEQSRLDASLVPRALMAWDTINFLFRRLPRHMWHQSAFDEAPAPQELPAAVVVAAMEEAEHESKASTGGLVAGDGDNNIDQSASENEMDDELDAEVKQMREQSKEKARKQILWERQQDRILQEQQRRLETLRKCAENRPPHCIIIEPKTLEEQLDWHLHTSLRVSRRRLKNAALISEAEDKLKCSRREERRQRYIAATEAAMKEKKERIEEMRRRKKERAALIKQQGKSRKYKGRGNGISTADVNVKGPDADIGDHASSKPESSTPKDECMEIDVEGMVHGNVMGDDEQPNEDAEEAQHETPIDEGSDECNEEANMLDSDNQCDSTDSDDKADDGVEHELDQEQKNGDVSDIDREKEEADGTYEFEHPEPFVSWDEFVQLLLEPAESQSSGLLHTIHIGLLELLVWELCAEKGSGLKMDQMDTDEAATALQDEQRTLVQSIEASAFRGLRPTAFTWPALAREFFLTKAAEQNRIEVAQQKGTRVGGVQMVINYVKNESITGDVTVNGEDGKDARRYGGSCNTHALRRLVEAMGECEYDEFSADIKVEIVSVLAEFVASSRVFHQALQLLEYAHERLGSRKREEYNRRLAENQEEFEKASQAITDAVSSGEILEPTAYPTQSLISLSTSTFEFALGVNGKSGGRKRSNGGKYLAHKLSLGLGGLLRPNTASKEGGPPCSVGTFPENLFAILEHDPPFRSIRWSSAGTSFILTKPKLFEVEVLPLYFKHKSCTSFVRQLHYYGFQSVVSAQDGVAATQPAKDMPRAYFQRQGQFTRTAPESAKTLRRLSHPAQISSSAQAPAGLVTELRSIGSETVSDKEFEAAKNMAFDVAKRVREQREEKQSKTGEVPVVEALALTSAPMSSASRTDKAHAPGNNSDDGTKISLSDRGIASAAAIDAVPSMLPVLATRDGEKTHLAAPGGRVLPITSDCPACRGKHTAHVASCPRRRPPKEDQPQSSASPTQVEVDAAAEMGGQGEGAGADAPGTKEAVTSGVTNIIVSTGASIQEKAKAALLATEADGAEDGEISHCPLCDFTTTNKQAFRVHVGRWCPVLRQQQAENPDMIIGDEAAHAKRKRRRERERERRRQRARLGSSAMFDQGQQAMQPQKLLLERLRAKNEAIRQELDLTYGRVLSMVALDLNADARRRGALGVDRDGREYFILGEDFRKIFVRDTKKYQEREQQQKQHNLPEGMPLLCMPCTDGVVKVEAAANKDASVENVVDSSSQAVTQDATQDVPQSFSPDFPGASSPAAAEKSIERNDGEKEEEFNEEEMDWNGKDKPTRPYTPEPLPMSEEGHHIVVGLLDNVGRQCDMMFGYTDEHDVQQPDGTTARQLALLYTGENEAKLDDECRALASDTAVKAKKDGTAPPPAAKVYDSTCCAICSNNQDLLC